MTQKLLVVDDDSDVRKTLTFLLEKNYVVLEASTGEEALRIINKERPRLMLLDIAMPGMSGIEVLQAARGIDKRVTIIMLTSESDLEVSKRALNIGAAEYITKPFDLNYLKTEIKRFMEAPLEGEEKNFQPPWRTSP